jgi:L-fuconolactonase
MRIDAHQHYWQIGNFSYPWLTANMPQFYRDYLPADLTPQLAANGIDATVVVQADNSGGETRWLLELATQEPTIAGVVGWADLTTPAIDEQLAELARSSYFKGIRPTLPQGDDWSSVDQGLRALATHGLTCDLLCRPPDLPRLHTLVAAYPDVSFVINHLAGQRIIAGETESWRSALAPLAANENVTMKVSGFLAHRNPQGSEDPPLGSYLDVALELFGANRLLFGSDWPVCRRGGEYADAVRILTACTDKLSLGEQAAIWGETARRVYNLNGKLPATPTTARANG